MRPPVQSAKIFANGAQRSVKTPFCSDTCSASSLVLPFFNFHISRVKNGNSVTTLRLTCFDD